MFVDERRSINHVQGPSNKGAAMVMGNCEEQWDKTYDLQFHAREAQDAVDAMATWREQLLPKQTTPAVVMPRPSQAPQGLAGLAADIIAHNDLPGHRVSQQSVPTSSLSSLASSIIASQALQC